jgi:Membrane protein involved in colicin uptake
MSGEGEAAGDVLTGAIVASAIDGKAGKPGPETHGKCLNCGAQVDGAYCASCGQRTHLHRSLIHIGHDILHGVFHFEGKMWRTIPELFFHPGRLTRRYIDGERAKFVSPMALYLFTVFLMFGVFSFTTSNWFDSTKDSVAGDVIEQWKEGNEAAKEKTDSQLEAVSEQLKEEDLTPQRRAELEKKLNELQSAKIVMDALASGDWEALKKLESDEQAKRAIDEANAKAKPPKITVDTGSGSTDVNLGWPALQKRLEQGARELKDNPSLAIYKIKIASYKYSWALIPLSVPLMWLLFFWRRDIHLYDHAIFITYSISFMMMFLILLTLAAAFGVSGAIWGTALGIVPPLHLYKQLRHTYKLSRFGAVLRLFLLSIGIWIVLMIFLILLTMIGMIG